MLHQNLSLWGKQVDKQGLAFGGNPCSELTGDYHLAPKAISQLSYVKFSFRKLFYRTSLHHFLALPSTHFWITQAAKT